MKGRWLWIVIIANLLVLVALAFVYPHLMVSPGPLTSGHAGLAADCFACHAPLRGASADRCMVCHALPDIGLRTTKGVPLKAVPSASASRLKMSFHQELIVQDCMACHSDHARPKLTQYSRKRFSHALLRPETRDHCESCHAAPGNDMHRNLSIGCAQCHKDQAWKPATFAHAKFFILDKDHNTSCATCHTADDYSKYTCYGCHEHTPANVSRKHIKEGIPNFENCVKCHRSAEGEREGSQSRGGEERRRKDEHD